MAKRNERIVLTVCFNGFGGGREAVLKALLTNEGKSVGQLVKFLRDTTPISYGGTRAPKTKRL